MSRPNLVALRGGDRTRPFGRRSYAWPGANQARGNLNSMPEDRGVGKMPTCLTYFERVAGGGASAS
ncbi:MAG: hypothetical protein F6Q13_14005, partial [Mycobacterium sp.]